MITESQTDRAAYAGAKPCGVAGRRVLFVINSNAGGGAEQIASLLATDLASQGAHVRTSFLYADSSGSAKAKLIGLARAARDVVRLAPDVLITFQPTSSVVAGVSGWLSGCRHRIVHQANMPLGTHPLPRLLDRLLGTLGLYSRIIVNSGATERAFDGYPRQYLRRMVRIDHGVAWRPPSRGRAAVREGYGLPPTQPIIMACSRLTAQKSLHTAVEAMAGVPGAHLVIAGDGPERTALTELAKRCGVGQRVHFLGHVDHCALPDLYSASDAFVFPSRWETFGLAAVEAAQHGIPVVASNLPVTHEVLGIGGASPVHFVETWEPADWAEALRSAIEQPESKAKALHFATEIRGWYGIDRMLAAYHALYRELLS